MSDLECSIRNVYEENKHSQKLLIKKTLALSVSANIFLAKLTEVRLEINENCSINIHFLIKYIKLSNSERIIIFANN